MYGFWITPERFVNFKGLYATYLNQLKALAYRFEDVFTGKTVRFHEPGIDGYIVEASKLADIDPYFTTYAMPKAQFVYTAAKTGTIAANLVPGSVLFATEGIFGYIADNGNGRLVKVDGSVIGEINYTTGAYKFYLTDADVATFGNVVVGYAVVGTNATYEDFDGTVSGATAKQIVGGQILNTQVGLTAMIITVSTSRKFFVGFVTNDIKCKTKIIEKLVGAPVGVTSMKATPATVAIDADADTTVEVTGATGAITATSSDEAGKVTASVSDTTVTIAAASDATAGSYTVTLTDAAGNKVTVSVTVNE